MQSMTTLKTYFPQLTGLRAIAAYLVFFVHYNPFEKEESLSSFYMLFRQFHVGVALFFVLSGFLITYRYYDLKSFSFKQYFVNRVARIYPLYFLLSTVNFIYYGIVKSESTLNYVYIYLLNITLLKGYFDQYKFSGIGQGWSLTVEETFYLLAPFVFLLLHRRWIFFYLLPLFFFCIGFGLVYVFKDFNAYTFMSSVEFMLRYTFWGRSIEFFTGIGLAILIKRGVNVNFKYFTYVGLCVILLCMFGLSFFYVNFGFKNSSPVGVLLNNLCLPLFGISCFFYGLLKEKTFISQALSTPFFVLLGKSSYAFYLIHLGFIISFFSPWLSNKFALFIFLNCLAIMLFKGVEEPLNHTLRKVFKTS